MPYWKGEKWACYSCTKGHRSSKCTHYDRILYKVRKPGRPLNNCPHVLPDSIPPGTFVNTSAESMANGQPPMEACNCKNDLVQVAIPKVKSCFCPPPGSADTIPPTPPESVSVTQSGVKKGRVNKRPIARRKKSIISEEAVNSARSEAVRVETAQTESPNTANGDKVSRTPCNLPGWGAYDVPVGPAPKDDHHADANDPTISELDRFWSSSRSNRIPDSPPPVSPTVIGVRHLLLSQNGSSTLPSNPGVAVFHGTYSRIQKDQNASTFIDPLNHKPRDYYSTPALSSIPQQSVALFPASQIDRHPSLVEDNPNGHLKTHPSTIQAPINGLERSVTVELTSHEWGLIQQIRASGIDIKEIAKIISTLRTHNGMEANGSLSSSANSPYTNLDSAHSSPSTMNGGSGYCAGNARSPHPPSSPVVNYPVRGRTCCGGGNSNGPPEPREPEIPACKCGEACRCVPCADHPHNPAMLAHIKENMELMGSGQNKFETPNLGGAWYDDEDAADAGEIGDFRDFVICDYQYGCATSCSNEGSGGCKCGEGCTCVGCLTGDTMAFRWRW